MVAGLPGCLLRRHHRGADLGAPVNPGDQPDKILYEKATNEIRHARYDVGRLTLQTLINTYPDSEYLAKAKLAIADSYYNEGGVSGLTQAEAEYRDFITFFPTAPEAPEAQYRVGMSHYREMAKADRERTQAKLAEAEFKEFLAKYPDNPLMPRVKARLRETQEVLAEGDYKIARFYYAKGANPAARSRFQEIIDSYPDFSAVDSSLWYLGQSLERLKKPREAIPYYSRILAEHPFSPLRDDAKARLVAMHQPIPRPTRAVLARARADAFDRYHQGLFGRLGGVMSSGANTAATRHGPVHLGPAQPAEVEMAKGNGDAAAPGNNIIVQPVGDKELNSAKAADPKTPNNAASADEKGQKGAAQARQGDSSDVPPPAKKKGRFHIFRKLNPF
jgi:outer membrane protein assembly factor BamD